MAKQEENKTGFWWKVYLVYAFFLLFAVGIVAATVKVVFIKGKELKEMSENQTLVYENTAAVRGNIYSADGALLAVSVPSFTVRWDMSPKVVCKDTFERNLSSLCDSMSRMYGDKTPGFYRQFFLKHRRAAKNRDVEIKKNLTYAEMQRMTKFPIFNKGRWKGGIKVTMEEVRTRPNDPLAARTIGSWNKTKKGYVGLEKAYDSLLTGINGHRLMQKMANGVYRPVFSADEIRPQNGCDLITTIDIRIQDVAETTLKSCMENYSGETGCVIVMEVQTGKVVAIANLGKRKDGTYGERENYAVLAGEPGSTFKLASTIAILEECGFDVKTKVETGTHTFFNREMIDSHRKGWGKVSYADAFAYSSNVGVSTVADSVFRKKPEKFIAYLKKMHMDRKLGVDIPGEGKPYIKEAKGKDWWGTSLPWMSIGYEVSVTPLQTVALYNAVANGGTMMKPMFVSEIRRGNETIKKFEPEVLVPEICSQKTLETVRSLLEGVVEYGTAKDHKSPLFKIAAKTGTAQMNYGKHGTRKSYRASFVGYFPADNPRYTCMVMITSPEDKIFYGAAVAGPVFRDVTTKIYATLMQGGREVNPSPVKGAVRSTAGRGEDIRKVYKMLGFAEPGIDKGTYYTSRDGRLGEINRLRKDAVPDVRGLGLRDASRLIEEQGLRMKSSGKGRVVSQNPAPGTPCAKGQTVVIELG